jgi:copper chaperone CopZ
LFFSGGGKSTWPIETFRRPEFVLPVMTLTYPLSGLTCSGCAAKVKSELLKVPAVAAAEISLDPMQVRISSESHVPLNVLSEAVARAGNYTISETAGINEMVIATGTSWFQTYRPLLLIFFFITLISFIVAFRGGFDPMIFMSTFMAGFFLVFSFFKFLDLRGFASSYSMYDVLAIRFPAYGFIYPFLEFGLGLSFVTGIRPVWTSIATILLMGFSSIGVIQQVVSGKKIACACLGVVFNLPMSTVTIVEDLAMVVMAGGMLFLS